MIRHVMSPSHQAAFRNNGARSVHGKAGATLDNGTMKWNYQVIKENTSFKQDAAKSDYSLTQENLT